MKIFWSAFWTALLSAIGVLAVGVFQEPLQRAFHGTELTADIYQAPWQPYPAEITSSSLSQESDLGVFEANDPEGMPLVMMKLKNNGTEDVKDVRVQVLSDRATGVLVRKGGNTLERQTLENLKNAKIGEIAAGDSVYVYLWIPYMYDIRYSAKEFRAFAPGRPFALKIHNYEDSDVRNFDESSYENVIAFWLPIVFIALVGVVVLMLWIYGALLFAYAKKLMGDEDFYLEERLRFDDNKKKWQPKLDDLTP